MRLYFIPILIIADPYTHMTVYERAMRKNDESYLYLIKDYGIINLIYDTLENIMWYRTEYNLSPEVLQKLIKNYNFTFIINSFHDKIITNGFKNLYKILQFFDIDTFGFRKYRKL